jgi:ankyrin repeat protein
MFVVRNDPDRLQEMLQPAMLWIRLFGWTTQLSLPVTAVRLARLESLSLMLDAGLSPDAHGRSEEAPLIEAVRAGDVESARVLLEYGASLEVRARGGVTSRHLAAQLGHADVLELLQQSR